MAKPVAREGDSWSGTCSHPSHGSPISVTGTITSSDSKFADQSIGVARHGDTVQASCGHTDTIVATTTKLDTQGIYIARVGDTTTGAPLTGQITSGSPVLESE